MRRTILGVALALLVTPAYAIDPYKRSDYGKWERPPGSCLDTRHQVLIAESVGPVTLEVRPNGTCRVTRGIWFGPFSNTILTDPKNIQIVHMVPLKEAHFSGAHAWPEIKKRQYYNDQSNPDHLLAAQRSLNRIKSAKDPAKWMPPANRCEYLRRWTTIKARWGLSMDAAEKAAIKKIREEEC